MKNFIIGSLNGQFLHDFDAALFANIITSMNVSHFILGYFKEGFLSEVSKCVADAIP